MGGRCAAVLMDHVDSRNVLFSLSVITQAKSINLREE